MRDRPEIESHGMGPCVNAVAKYQEAVISTVVAEKTVMKISNH
jgi:hypothetical protein